MGYKNYKDLEVYQKARVFRNEIEDLSKSYSSEEKFKLVDQIIRSSRAVTAHIAEGHGRFHYKEYIQRCRSARGELMETDDHLTVALDRKYIDQETYQNFEKKLYEIERMLNGNISYLQKRLAESKKQIAL